MKYGRDTYLGIGEYEEIRLQGKVIELPPPDPIPQEPFVGRDELIEEALAAWSTLDGGFPLHFRVYGRPGTGKTSLVFHLARLLNKELYIMNGDDDTRVEDIACIPSIDERDTGKLKFRASPLFAAMLRGQICFFDEIAKAPSGALAALSPVLDARRALESKTAGVKIRAAEGFLFCAALNEDEEISVGLPGYIAERTLPAIHVGNPTMEELEGILLSKGENRERLWVECFIDEFKDKALSPRAAIKLLEYAVKLFRRAQGNGRSGKLTRKEAVRYLKKAAEGFLTGGHETEASSEKGTRDEEVIKGVCDLFQEFEDDSLQ